MENNVMPKYKYVPGTASPAKDFKSRADIQKEELTDYYYTILQARTGIEDNKTYPIMNQMAIYEGKNNRHLLNLASGTKDIVNNQPCDNETRIGIGSQTKMYAGAMIELFIDLGYITSRDDDVNDYLNPKYNFPALGVTIEQALTHTSRLWDVPVPDVFFETPKGAPSTGPGNCGLAYYNKFYQNGQVIQTAAELRAEFVDWWKGRTFPGQRDGADIAVGEFSYSNSGYIMLALIVEEAYEAEFGQFKLFDYIVQTYIFDPAGMTTASCGGTDAYTEVPNEWNNYVAVNQAKSYTYYGSEQWGYNTYATTPTHPVAALGAGNIIASTADHSKFLSFVASGDFMSSAAVDQFFTGRSDSSAQFGNRFTATLETPVPAGTGSQYCSGIMEYELLYYDENADGYAGRTGRMLYTHAGLIDGAYGMSLYDKELDVCISIQVNKMTNEVYAATGGALNDTYKKYIQLYHPSLVNWPPVGEGPSFN